MTLKNIYFAAHCWWSLPNTPWIALLRVKANPATWTSFIQNPKSLSVQCYCENLCLYSFDLNLCSNVDPGCSGMAHSNAAPRYCLYGPSPPVARCWRQRPSPGGVEGATHRTAAHPASEPSLRPSVKVQCLFFLCI